MDFILQTPSKPWLTVAQKPLIRIGKLTIVIYIYDLVIAGLLSIFCCLLSLVRLPNAIGFIIPYRMYRTTYKPLIFNIIQFIAVFIKITIETDNLIPV